MSGISLLTSKTLPSWCIFSPSTGKVFRRSRSQRKITNRIFYAEGVCVSGTGTGKIDSGPEKGGARARKMAERDNLEYYIKFPSPGQQAGDNDFVFVVDEEKVPVVVLFGWAGCQDKYLSKYSQIYEDRGLITLRYTAPVKFLFWKRHQLKTIGERIVKLLVDMNFESHPLIVHCFSNGGAFLYQNLSVALGQSSKPMQLKGVIFDSAPGPRRVLSLFRAMSAIIGGSFFYNFPVTVLVTAFLIIMWEYEIIKSYFFPDNFRSDPFEYLKRENNMCPQHFIFSKADTLILHTDVEKFIESRRSKSVDISALRFDASPHVKHYTHHRDEYIASVCSFLTKCLKAKAN